MENPKIDAFLAEIAEVSKKHGLSIAHEDAHGNFEIEKFNMKNIEWLNDASDRTGEN